jgi:hydrogenase maturation protein HypF
MPDHTMTGAITARRMRLGGRVQGVGFRPFVYRLARREGLTGWVRNLSGQVEILAQGAEPALLRFTTSLLDEAPPLARPALLSVTQESTASREGFAVLASDADEPPDVHVPPDQFTCDDCLRELADPNDRRHRYPFINCTQCGPRYTLITRLPYDRPNTTMAGFGLCTDCAAEYANPSDRRFHAEPIACPACGPRLRFVSGTGADATGEAALEAALAALRQGKILAVKGIGGYHFMCDALSAGSIALLRERKRRPHKPLAVMLPQDDRAGWLGQLVCPTGAEMALLADPMRPIVLMRKRLGAAMPDGLAPGLDELGVMLPYSPLHHLLLRGHGGPLVATSANPSGEPVLTDNAMVESRLGSVVDGFLHHDRPIVRPADDPVYRIIGGKPRPIRLGRGNAPAEYELPFALRRPMLALGGQMKATIALGWDRRVVVSPHLGDMDTPRGVALLRQTAEDLQTLYGVRATALCRDAHPGYASTRLARDWGLPVIQVFHHASHASALAAEHARMDGDGTDSDGRWIVFTWDGTGLGPDHTIWGGEALVGGPGHWQRQASLRPFRLSGGEMAAPQPWRSALALAWESGHDWTPDDRDTTLLRQAWERGVNCVSCTSVGRMFDAAAAMLGLVTTASFEGQAPMHLEAVAGNDPTGDGATEDDPTEDDAPGDDTTMSLPLARDSTGVWRTDWAPLLPALCDARRTIASRAALFHASLAAALLAQATVLRAETGISRLGLTGGVFQNRRLTETVQRLAEAAGFSIVLPERLPCNDAGLSFGQLVEADACP